jgi:KaiC/GvpD/RAD55 family RecA-like ATPase
MPIQVPIPGLSNFVREVPEGSVLYLEGGLDYVKSSFALALAGSAAERGWMPFVATTRWADDLKKELASAYPRQAFEVVDGVKLGELASVVAPKRVIIIDSFSHIAMESSLGEFKGSMEKMRAACKSTGSVVILVADSGVLGREREAAASQMSDGTVQFLTREVQERLSRFIRIPKWMGGLSLSDNLYYDYDGRRISIDLRARVV